MILYIAEKPSLGRAIAAVLPKPHRSHEGYIELGNGDCVSWCVGHLLQPAEPDHYDPMYKQWRLEHLPIVPEPWQLTPRKNCAKQLSVLRKLMRTADQLVHCGDPDREGQLLVDEVVHYGAVAARKVATMQRCLINDLNPEAVRRALGHLKSNREFIPLSTSALARSRADWLYGINMTRAATIQGQKVGYQGVLSVGRVQTPLLGLVVERDRQISEFVSRPYYEVWARVKTTANDRFRAKWQSSDACLPYMDEEGRVISRPLAENVCRRIEGMSGVVRRADSTAKKQAPPLPYSLSILQIEAAKAHGLSAKQVLDICQVLYERHKLITYPRSDCRYLPAEHLDDVSKVLEAIGQVSPALQTGIANADRSLRSKAWNSHKVGAHHGIIPTKATLDPKRLNATELQIYTLIARQYLAQFYAPWRYDDRCIELEIAGGAFIAKSRQTTAEGWRSLFADNRHDKEDTETNSVLPMLNVGAEVDCEGGDLLDKQTLPPKPFTDASLLSAMTGIARFVTDSQVRKILRDTDGLGTEATRASMIELLFKRGFLQRQGKQIHASPAGKALIANLPKPATVPDMTAQWEVALERIASGQERYQIFIDGLITELDGLLQTVAQTQLQGLLSGPVEKRKRTAGRQRKRHRRV